MAKKAAAKKKTPAKKKAAAKKAPAKKKAAVVKTEIQKVDEAQAAAAVKLKESKNCLLYTSPSPRDRG